MDNNWPVCHVLATALWLIGITLAACDLITPMDTGPLGVVAAAGAGTLNARGWIADSARRESAAFGIGREAGMRAVPRR